MYRLLLVTDQPALRKDLKSALLEGGCGVSMVESQALFAEGFDPGKSELLLVDLEHAQAEPRRLVQAVKRDRRLKELPLVLLVTEAQLGQLDVAWEVDDYLTLPVSAERLLARIKFLLWKLNKVALRNGLKIGELAIDFERYEVRVKGELVDVTYKEFELLRFLLRHPGRVFTREALLDKVWGYDYYGGTRTVDVHIRRLRSKIETGASSWIQTVRNVGYKFVASDSSLS